MKLKNEFIDYDIKIAIGNVTEDIFSDVAQFDKRNIFNIIINKLMKLINYGGHYVFIVFRCR